MPTTVTKRREVYILCGAVWLRAVCTVDKLFVPSERIRTIMKGGGERNRIYYVRSCSAQCSVRTASHKLFMHSERIRTVTQGDRRHVYFVLNPCAILSLLKYIINGSELFAKQQKYI